MSLRLRSAPITLAGNSNNFRGQLGVPNAHRAAKSRGGYEVEALAVGFSAEGGGVIRSSEKYLLTPPELLRERTDKIVNELLNAGKDLPENIRPRMTAQDKALAQNAQITWWFLRVMIQVSNGEISISDYEGAPKTSDLHKLPISDKQFQARALYADMLDHLPAEIVGFFDWVSQHDSEVELVKTRAEKGREYTQGQDARHAEGAIIGLIGGYSRILAEIFHDCKTKQMRNKTMRQYALSRPQFSDGNRHDCENY